MAAKEGEQHQTANHSNSLQTMITTDPWMLFLYGLKAPATKDKYIQRLTIFLDFLGYTGTKEEKARAFAAQVRADQIYAFNSVLKFFECKLANRPKRDGNRYGQELDPGTYVYILA